MLGILYFVIFYDILISKELKFMYCSNCGEKVQDGASFCANCGNALKGEKQNLTNNSSNVTIQSVPGSGTAIASMVLGIIAIIAGVITFFIAMGMSTYMDLSHSVHEIISNTYHSELMITAISVIFLPAVLSIIGICLAIGSRGKIKNGANTAGIVLNLITIFLCVAEYIIIAG